MQATQEHQQPPRLLSPAAVVPLRELATRSEQQAKEKWLVSYKGGEADLARSKVKVTEIAHWRQR